MKRKRLSIRTLEQRRRRLLDRVDQLLYQRDLFLSEAEVLRLLAAARRDLDGVVAEIGRRRMAA